MHDIHHKRRHIVGLFFLLGIIFFLLTLSAIFTTLPTAPISPSSSLEPDRLQN